MTTTATIVDILHPNSPPITCQSWCQYGDGHTDDLVINQSCFGIEHRVPLHLTKMTNEAGPGEEPDWQHEYLTVYLEKLFAHEPTVCLGRGELSGVMMTTDEAHKLALNLLFVVAQISGQA